MTAVQEKTFSVLLADDTYDIRVLTRIVLERSGWFDVVGEAEDGQRAIDQAAALQPDVILLDLAMPVMDGLAALPGIREAAPDARVIVLSGFEKAAMAEEANRLGAVAYLQKGMHKDQLVAEILAVCGVEEATAAAPPAAKTADGERSPRAAPTSNTAPSGADAGARAAHELRSPLTTIIGSAQTLRQRWAELDEDTRTALLEAIERQGRRMERLVDDLLTMSRLDAGTFPITIADHRTAELVALAVNGVGPVEPPIHVEVAGDPIVRADGDRVIQMLDNLLVNAYRYGRSPFSVSVAETDRVVHFVVSDHGPGVPAELVGNLFNRWSPAATGQAGSVGLGLSIVRELAEAQGGRVSYRSGPDGGAEFSFALPAAR